MKELIRVNGLTKSFLVPAGELTILKGIDCAFYEGEMVGIVGASGAGKSTFLHILGGLDSPTSGSILYNAGYNVRKEDTGGYINPFSLGSIEMAHFRSRMVGFVFQFHYLLPEFTAIENVMMPGLISRSQKIEVRGQREFYEKAEALLSELDVCKRKDHKPGELSGGEQQRVAVARALIMEPKVVFADEPTGNLDTVTGDGLFRMLMDINQKSGITFIVVTHNESLSKRCHRTLEMVDGRLADSKTHQV
ncbi:MAG: ABC transporter ATP-binding protein [Nitrospirae bacterium]|nr:ABC transporter ATP-binding protein [Nitrospirota bacterium]